MESSHQDTWRPGGRIQIDMCDVVRRIGGRNSHPGLHRVLANAGPYPDAGLQYKPGLVRPGLNCARSSRFAVPCIRYAPGSSASCAGRHHGFVAILAFRSEEHTSELQSLMRISYAVFCLKKKKTKNNITTHMLLRIH